MKKILVTGAGGFIGFHLANALVQKGYWVRAVDIKEPEYEACQAHEFELLDLRKFDNCLTAVRGGIEEIYHLAADMGGVGYTSSSHAQIAKNSSLINIHMLEAARICGVKKFLFSSTACVYPLSLQTIPDAPALKEDDVFPADPEEGYGWEKLYMEKLCQYYREDYGLETHVVRFHNVYGPKGTYDGGKEKVPAAVSRKLAMAKDGDVIEVWGDGEQTRSFIYIDDCVEGIYRLMNSDYVHPLNLGMDEMISINDLYDLVSEIAGKKIGKRHDLTKPQGVRGRNSDNTRLREVLKWEPSISVKEGIVPTYAWIKSQVNPD
jgi:GDP-D-mannose 3', 5'-epimerase